MLDCGLGGQAPLVTPARCPQPPDGPPRTQAPYTHLISGRLSLQNQRQGCEFLKQANARKSADWKGKRQHFVALQTSQAQPIPIKTQLSNSVEFALLDCGFGGQAPLVTPARCPQPPDGPPRTQAPYLQKPTNLAADGPCTSPQISAFLAESTHPFAAIGSRPTPVSKAAKEELYFWPDLVFISKRGQKYKPLPRCGLAPSV